MKGFKYTIVKLFLFLIALCLSIGLYRLESFGFPFTQEALQKGIVLVALLCIMLTAGIKQNVNPVLMAGSYFLISSVFIGDDWGLYATSFFGFSLSWLVLNIRWAYPPEDILKYVSSISLLSSAFGVLLYMLGDSICRLEQSGTCRLLGGLTPAHLGFLAFYGVVACSIRIADYNRGVILLAANLLICLLTFSRVASTLSVVTVLLLIFIYSKRKSVKALNRVLATLVSVPAIVVLSVLVAIALLDRTVDSDGLIDTSGRLVAWEYFVDAGLRRPWFGYGSGASLTLTEDTASYFFSVPHNEFIHYFYDVGLLGASAIFSSLIYLFWRTIASAKVASKPILKLLAVQIFVYCLTDNVMSTIQSTLPLALIFWYFQARAARA